MEISGKKEKTIGNYDMVLRTVSGLLIEIS
jgi:hypothetical protein